MKYKAGDPRKYKGLDMSEECRTLLIRNPGKFASYCNGVGSKVGGWFRRLIYRITPNTIWGLNITPCSDIHDVDYSIKRRFKTKKQALNAKFEIDTRFVVNLQVYINENTSWEWLKELRLRRVWKYELLLRECGEDSFMEAVTITE
jgi:hypothetical protein